MKHIKLLIILMLISFISGLMLQAEIPEGETDKATSEISQYLKLSGKVKSYDKTPIEGAIVLIPELGQSTETDADGNYEFSAVVPGKYHLEVVADSYMTFQTEMFSLEKTNLVFNITLVKKLSEEIVVTATRTEKIYAEVPVKTEIITAREIEQKQATQLAESLALTTGVRVENNCQNCNFTQVRINGMEGKYSQILIDNSPIFSSMIGVYGLEQIPAEMLNRIEVVKGGGSALYGGNAIAGVINVLTKEPEENATRIRLHQESILGESMTNAGVRTNLVSRDQQTKAFLFANYRNRTPMDVNGDNFSEQGKLKSYNLGANFYRYFSDIDGKLKISLFHISEDRRGGNRFEVPPHEADIAEAIDSLLYGLALDWNHYLNPSLYYNLGASYVHAKRDTYYGSLRDPNAYGKSANPVLFLSGQMNYQKGAHLLSTGLQFKGEQIDDEALGYGRRIDDTYREFGFFIQDDFKINNTFSLLTGLRLSKHSLVNNLIVNPRLSFLMNISRDLSWRTTFSTGFRAPQVFDEDLHITQVGGEGMIIENSPDLKEETSYSLSTGFDYGRQIGRSLWQLSVEGFYTLLTDTFILEEQEFDPRENALVFQRINGSNSRVYGISVDLGLSLGVFALNSGWTFQRSKLDEPEPDFGATRFFRTPNTYGYLTLNYENEKLVDADISLEYTGSMIAPHFAGYIAEDRLETTGSFWVLNAKLSRPILEREKNSINLFVGVYNLFNSYQPDLDKGVFRDSAYVYGPQKPRAVFAGFEFSF